jgi:hypothetical protein
MMKDIFVGLVTVGEEGRPISKCDVFVLFLGPRGCRTADRSTNFWQSLIGYGE